MEADEETAVEDDDEDEDEDEEARRAIERPALVTTRRLSMGVRWLS